MDEERLHRVISGALSLWGVSGTIDRVNAGAFIISTVAARVRVEQREKGGWRVSMNTELVGEHAGLPGLLRTLREALAPHAPAGRLIIGA